MSDLMMVIGKRCYLNLIGMRRFCSVFLDIGVHSWKMTIFWIWYLVFRFFKKDFVSSQWKSAWLLYELSFISALGIVSSEWGLEGHSPVGRSNYGILFPKLFWPTVKKNCSNDREHLLKFEAKPREFAKNLRFSDLIH